MDMEYPLKDCEDCMHNRVCKHVEAISKIVAKGTLPIDFASAACFEYTPESVLSMGDEEMEDAMDELELEGNWQEALESIIDKICSKGLIPDSIAMSSATYQAIAKDVLPPDATPGYRISDLITRRGKMEVVIDESVPDGEFHIGTVY